MMPSALIPLSALRANFGKIVVTLDIYGLDPLSLKTDTENIEAIIQIVDEGVRESGGSRHEERSHVFVRRLLVQTVRTGNDEDKTDAMLTTLWLALNHPHHIDDMRRGISASIRRDGRAHLTVSMDQRRNWSFCLANRYVDMSPLLATVPDGHAVSVAFRDVDDDTRMHS